MLEKKKLLKCIRWINVTGLQTRSAPTINRAKGELKGDDVSKAQLGAFFAAMTIRANSFPDATNWSEGERRAMNLYWPHLVQALPPDVVFIADPEGTIMGIGNLPCYVDEEQQK
ncbi:hypothetical protein KSP40_PGU016414 [Platanthera guangdongensis]|uniref:Uncharacterized protein n=1 Tax=Platanthera guangdongensis TaxID=2320717 RepID=A0ABR2M916_9ASPA